MKELMKGKAVETAKVRIHNDVANAAFYFKNIIVEKRENGGGGIILDCMACATMLAFTWEALSDRGDNAPPSWKVSVRLAQLIGGPLATR